MQWDYQPPLGGGGGGGGIAIGDVVSGAITNAILYVGAGSVLANDTSFKWANGVVIVSPADAAIPLSITAGATQTGDLLKTEVNSVQTATINAAGEFTHSPGGAGNEVFGIDSLGVITTGQSNTAFGHQALMDNQAGNNNTAFGYLALTDNIDGSSNLAVGYRALTASTAGIYNVAMGIDALLALTSGNSNIAIGHLPLKSLVSGIGNIAIGASTMTSQTGGNDNVGIGRGALQLGETGSDNIAIGQDSLKVTVSGSNNVAVGESAGQNTLGSNNVYVGYQVGQNETGSNTLYIDNSNTATPLIYGDFSTEELTFNGTVFIRDDDDLSIAGAPVPTANPGDMLVFGGKVAIPTMANNTAGIYAASDGGNIRTLAIDEDGISKSLTGAAGEIHADAAVGSTTFSGSSNDFSNKTQIDVFTTDSPARGTTPDHTNDHITINEPGLYAITTHISLTGAVGNIISFAFFKNDGATQLGARGTRQLNANTLGSLSIVALEELSANDTIELWAQNESASTAISVHDLALRVVKI